jgi:hypothetical protein
VPASSTFFSSTGAGFGGAVSTCGVDARASCTEPTSFTVYTSRGTYFTFWKAIHWKKPIVSATWKMSDPMSALRTTMLPISASCR